MRWMKVMVASAILVAGSAFAQSLVLDGKLKLSIDSVTRVSEYKQPPPQSAYVASAGKEFVVVRLTRACVHPGSPCDVEAIYGAHGYELRTAAGKKVFGMVVTVPGSGNWLEVLFQELPKGEQLESLSLEGATASLATAAPPKKTS